MKRAVAIGETDRRVGQDHPRAVLSNHEVDQLLNLHDDGVSYLELAGIFGICKSAVAHIVKGRRRCQLPVRYKTVEVRECTS